MPGKTRKAPSVSLPPLTTADLEAKRNFARLVARTLIATRDLMNAHFLAEPTGREDGKLKELSYAEDVQGFYNVHLHYPNLELRERRKNNAFIQVNFEQDFDGKKKTELDDLTEALHASFTPKGLRNICKEVAAYWRQIKADNRELLTPLSKPLQALVEALEKVTPRKRSR